jgi:hypothetical protein
VLHQSKSASMDMDVPILIRNSTKKFEFGVTLSWRNFETVFSKSENTEFLLQKKCYGAEILYGTRHFNCGWKIDKSNKKRKKVHAEDRIQTSSGLTAKFKFLSQVYYKQRHPHPLMQILIDAAQYCSGLYVSNAQPIILFIYLFI